MGQAEPSVSVDDGGEPAVWRRELNEKPSVWPRPDAGQSFPSMDKSASRLDLVKYAAASGDYNPIHFDHDAARGAGLDGIVVHGLLMAAWALQAASGVSARSDPIAHVKLRFHNPLQPGAQASVTGMLRDVSEDAGDARVGLAVTSNDQQLVTAQCVVRLGA
jgi:acyl dehydratase